ncbi:E3 ubiquitin-protein ligase BRE1-like 2, partial [Linum grandiflorum]
IQLTRGVNSSTLEPIHKKYFSIGTRRPLLRVDREFHLLLPRSLPRPGKACGRRFRLRPSHFLMENSESDEPDKKRPHLNSPLSPAMSPNHSTSPANNHTVDVAVLHHQNQKLVQQLDVQKRELRDLEAKIEELKANQASYDDILITANQAWNELVDDLILLTVRAGGRPNVLQTLDHADNARGMIPSCPAEDMFLCRFLGQDSLKNCGNDGVAAYTREILASRHSFTIGLMESLETTIDTQRMESETIRQALDGNLSTEDAIIQLSRLDDMMREEAKSLHEVIDNLQMKHKEYVDGIQNYISTHSTEQSEISRLAGELEECLAELEDSQRKLIDLEMQKDKAAALHGPVPSAANGTLSPEKLTDRSKGLRELKDSIEEMKVLAADRLSELQDAQDENKILSKHLEVLQNELKDDKHINLSRLYNLVNDQLQHWNAEVERYKVMLEVLQADRSSIVRREKEAKIKLESTDSARNSIDSPDSRIQDLELQLQKCKIEKNELEIKMEEAVQDSGRKDIKAEFRIMASALSKEMGVMEAQLNRWKQTADEAISLREKSQSLKSLLTEKTNEQNCLAGKCAEQVIEITTWKTQIESLQKEKLELQTILDMFGQEDSGNRDIDEIKESKRRALSQVDTLQSALDEHPLQLRVKAAKEAEMACQQRLTAAEAEIVELRAKLDASDRDVMELKEAIASKDRDAEAFISEIETIGQAYEDMQTQNQHLLQQVTERDDYNIKLVSDSVKTKQAQTVLLAEKQALTKQLQQLNTSIEQVKSRIAHSEEQMKACFAEAIQNNEEDRHLTITLETARWELTDAEKEQKWIKYALSSSEKEYEQIQKKSDEVGTELETERYERQKVEEELLELNNQIVELTSETGEAAILKLQDEIKDCKRILKCSVCSDRPKEVVIVKCYHLFCNPCIQRNLELRHRKCPGCGTAFGQSDVRFVKI